MTLIFPLFCVPCCSFLFFTVVFIIKDLKGSPASRNDSFHLESYTLFYFKPLFLSTMLFAAPKSVQAIHLNLLLCNKSIAYN